MTRLTKKTNPVALVTGSGRRLGRDIVISLSEMGYDVVINYHRSRTSAIETARLIRDKGRRVIVVRADVSRKTDVSRLMNRTRSAFGRLDLLVNNAAIFTESPFLKTSERIWNNTLDVNLKGTFLCCQAAVPLLLKSGGGRIINIASIGGVRALRKHVPYSISKAGVIMLTRILAKSLAPSILVNAVAPGSIELGRENDRKNEHIPLGLIPLKRYGDVKDVTSLIQFLAKTSNYITGQIISVDGGASIL